MILQKEIVPIATQKGVVKSTIDKDWALGHVHFLTDLDL